MVAEKMADGGLSVDNVRLLGAVVGQDRFADDADLLLEIASGSPRETRRGLERWLAINDPGGESDREEALWVKRHLTFTSNGEGMYDVKGLLMPADVAAVQVALDHIAGAAYADETGRPHHTRIADAFVELCKAYNSGTVTGGRERPKVLITVPFETVVERGAARGVIIGLDATVSAETVRQMCCDAELNRVVTRGRSTILDYGTTTRLASDAQYYALVARDGGCRWPGCERPPGWCDVHHIDEVTPRRRTHRPDQPHLELCNPPRPPPPQRLEIHRHRRRPMAPTTRRHPNTSTLPRTRIHQPTTTPTRRRMNRYLDTKPVSRGVGESARNVLSIAWMVFDLCMIVA